MIFTDRPATAEEQTLLGGFPTHKKYQDLVAGLAATAAGAAGGRVPVISIAGSQGTGKSTMSAAIASLLNARSLKVAIVSLDDFYLTKEERRHLGAEIHPLLSTRGVPGTHDIGFMSSAVSALRQRQPVELPVFDKAMDDRSSEVRKVESVDIVICEGWCWGAPVQQDSDIDEAINELESTEDPDGSWRQFVNMSLSRYQDLFETDFSVFLKAPSMEAVHRWRWQQEYELAKNNPGAQTMSEGDVRRFIQHYERLTRWMLAEMPARVDLTVHLNDAHQVETVEVVEAIGDSGSIQ